MQDIIILAEEAVYKKVNTGTDGDRVYLMEIAGNRRFFYWMQDKNSEKDEVSCSLLSLFLLIGSNIGSKASSTAFLRTCRL